MTDRRTGRASQNGICSSMKAVSSAFGCRPRVRPGVVARRTAARCHRGEGIKAAAIARFTTSTRARGLWFGPELLVFGGSIPCRYPLGRRLRPRRGGGASHSHACTCVEPVTICVRLFFGAFCPGHRAGGGPEPS